MIREVCLYVTRKCNIACRYCNVIKHKKPELSTEEMKKVLDIVCDEIKPELLVVFGGEPFMRKDLQELLDYIKGRVTYTIISNSILPLKYEGIESLTASIDSLETMPVLNNEGDKLKTNVAIRRLMEAKAKGIGNVTGNIIAHRENYWQVPRLIEHLSICGIWSIVGVVHCGQGREWTFRSTGENMNLNVIYAEWLSQELIRLKKKPGILLHNSMEYLEGIARYGSSLDWHCSKPYYLTIDCDGKLIACNDHWGDTVSQMSIFDFDLTEFEKNWAEDVGSCPGCYYNHQVQVENRDEVIKRW